MENKEQTNGILCNHFGKIMFRSTYMKLHAVLVKPVVKYSSNTWTQGDRCKRRREMRTLKRSLVGCIYILGGGGGNTDIRQVKGQR
jgi:hypothetical protein